MYFGSCLKLHRSYIFHFERAGSAGNIPDYSINRKHSHVSRKNKRFPGFHFRKNKKTKKSGPYRLIEYSQIFPNEPPFEINEHGLSLRYLLKYILGSIQPITLSSLHSRSCTKQCREAFESRWLLPFSSSRFSGITSYHLKKTQKKLRRVSNTFSLTSLPVIRIVMLVHTLCNRRL
jgi:hypothetical protein